MVRTWLHILKHSGSPVSGVCVVQHDLPSRQVMFSSNSFSDSLGFKLFSVFFFRFQVIVSHLNFCIFGKFCGITGVRILKLDFRNCFAPLCFGPCTDNFNPLIKND